MLYSKTTGNGPVIIFIHGNSQNHHVWDHVVNNSTLKNYTKVVIDLPGHGLSFRSQHPEKDYTLRGIGQHLVDFANQYSAQGYILVGSSLGTNCIAEGAYHLKNCKGAFLMGASIIGENVTLNEIVQPNPNVATLFWAIATDAELDALLRDEAHNVSAELNASLKAMYHDTDPNLRTQLGQSIANQDYGDEIGKLWKQNLPIALVYGADEKIVNSGYMDKLNLKLWHNEIIKLPETGHCCQLDNAGLIAQMIAEFASESFK